MHNWTVTTHTDLFISVQSCSFNTPDVPCIVLTALENVYYIVNTSLSTRLPLCVVCCHPPSQSSQSAAMQYYMRSSGLLAPTECHVSWSVTLVSPAKAAEPIKMPFELWTRMGPRNRVRWGPDSPLEWAILEERCAMSCAKTAEVVDLPFGLWSPVGKGNRFKRIRQVAPICPDRRIHLRHLASTTEPSILCGSVALCQAAFWVEDLGGPGEPCIRWGSRSPDGKGQIFWGEWASHCTV